MSGPRTTNPKVSIVVPVYGVEAYIERCCDSLFAQTFRDFDIVFVSDCPKDRSEALLHARLAAHAGSGVAARVIRHEQNRGVSAARETGFQASTGVYVWYVDSDDHLAPHALQTMVDAAERTGADLVYCDYAETLGGRTKPVSQAVADAGPRAVVAAMLLQKIVWAPWNKLFRRALAQEFDVHWPPGINIGEDLMVMTRLMCHARRIEHVGEALYFYNRDNVGSSLNAWKPLACRHNLLAVTAVVGFVQRDPHAAALQAAVVHLKLMARFQLLYPEDDALRQLAADSFPETNPQIFGYAFAGRHWKTALWLLAHRQRWLGHLMLSGISRLKRAKRARPSPAEGSTAA